MIYPLYFQFQSNITTGLLFGGQARKIPTWPNSYESFYDVVEKMKANGDDLPLFINGWSVYKVGEQTAADVAPLVARSMKPQPLAAYPGIANYPNGPDNKGVHTESWIKTLDGNLFGFWMDKDAFYKDYEKALNKPRIDLHGPDNKVHDPFTLKPIDD